MITWDEWEDKYLPTTPLAYGDLSEIDDDLDYHYIWTMVDGEGRYANLLNGIHIVNRLGYFVTEKPWEEDVFVTDQKEMYA
jgi:hypothetical protein